jgi:hypothetical protein
MSQNKINSLAKKQIKQLKMKAARMWSTEIRRVSTLEKDKAKEDYLQKAKRARQHKIRDIVENENECYQSYIQRQKEVERTERNKVTKLIAEDQQNMKERSKTTTNHYKIESIEASVNSYERRFQSTKERRLSSENKIIQEIDEKLQQLNDKCN